MSVKASISLTETQDQFARELVGAGKYSSLSAVLQQGLELLRAQTEAQELEAAALRQLIDERRSGDFIDPSESKLRLNKMLARKKREYDL